MSHGTYASGRRGDPPGDRRRGGRRPEGPASGIRDRDRCQDQRRPEPCARVRERARRRGGPRARRARGHARGPAQRARLPAGPRRHRAAPEAHARRSSSSTTTRPTARCASRRCSTRSAARERAQPTSTGRQPRAGARAHPRGPRFVLATHENPDGDALGSLVAMHGLLTALGKDSVMFIAPSDLPLPREYRCFAAASGADPEPPAPTSPSARSCSSTAATSTATRRSVLRDGAHLLNIDHHHDNTRFGTLNYVVPAASCTAEIVWDLMHGLGVRPDAGCRRGAVHRADHRHRALHVREHRPARAPDGRRADRGGRRRAGRLPAPVRGHAARQARRCSRSRSARVQRFDAGELTLAALSAEDFAARGRRGQLLRGHHRPAARASQGTKVAVLVRELTARRARGPAQSLAARDRRRRRRVGDRARPGRRRAPPRRRLLDDARARGAGRVPARGDRRAAAPARRTPRRSPDAAPAAPRRATGWTASC